MVKRNRYPSDIIYHVFNKSIANFGIFQSPRNSLRFLYVLDYYNNERVPRSYSNYLIINKEYKYENILFPKLNNLVKIISYCIMPDHYHLLLKVLKDDCISKFIGDVENSYTRYFNLRSNRKGPLWQSRFKSVKIKSNEQLLHVSRYQHLNPTTAGLVVNPEDWEFSSYRDFITNEKILKEIITEISIKETSTYKKFVENNQDYQRKLKMIKRQIFE